MSKPAASLLRRAKSAKAGGRATRAQYIKLDLIECPAHSLHAGLLAAAPALVRSLVAEVLLQTVPQLRLQLTPCARIVAVRVTADCHPAHFDHSRTRMQCHVSAAVVAGAAALHPAAATAVVVAAVAEPETAAAAALKTDALPQRGYLCCCGGCQGCLGCVKH